jgi:hypothetical protein
MTVHFIETRCIPEPNTGCWLWERSVSEAGYGTLTLKLISKYAHRLAWEVFRGPIPDGLSVLHKCDVRSCVNPDHLFLGTDRDNSDDKIAKGRDRHPGQLGEANANAKLTKKAIGDIRSQPNENLRILAEKYGVSRQAIWKVRHGVGWKE